MPIFFKWVGWLKPPTRKQPTVGNPTNQPTNPKPKPTNPKPKPTLIGGLGKTTQPSGHSWMYCTIQRIPYTPYGEIPTNKPYIIYYLGYWWLIPSPNPQLSEKKTIPLGCIPPHGPTTRGQDRWICRVDPSSLGIPEIQCLAENRLLGTTTQWWDRDPDPRRSKVRGVLGRSWGESDNVWDFV